MVGAKGFEPSTPWSQTKYSNQTELRPENSMQALCHTLLRIPKHFRNCDYSKRFA